MDICKFESQSFEEVLDHTGLFTTIVRCYFQRKVGSVSNQTCQAHIFLFLCGWKAAQEQKIRKHWLTTVWTWTQSSCVPRWPRRPLVFWLVSEIVWPGGWGQGLFPFSQHCWGHILNTMVSFGSLTPKKTLRCWGMSRDEQQGWWRVWSINPIRSAWGGWCFLAQRQRGSGEPYHSL